MPHVQLCGDEILLLGRICAEELFVISECCLQICGFCEVIEVVPALLDGWLDEALIGLESFELVPIVEHGIDHVDVLDEATVEVLRVRGESHVDVWRILLEF